MQGMVNALRQLGVGKISRKKQTYIDRYGNLQDDESSKIWERDE